MTDELSGLLNGTSTTEIFLCNGSLPFGGPFFCPQVGPGRSGYDDTYTSSRGLVALSANPGHAVIVWAPQSVYTALPCWMSVRGFAGSSPSVKTRTPSQPLGSSWKGVPSGCTDRGAPHSAPAIVRSTAKRSRSATPLPLRSQAIGSA